MQPARALKHDGVPQKTGLVFLLLLLSWTAPERSFACVGTLAEFRPASQAGDAAGVRLLKDGEVVEARRPSAAPVACKEPPLLWVSAMKLPAVKEQITALAQLRPVYERELLSEQECAAAGDGSYVAYPEGRSPLVLQRVRDCRVERLADPRALGLVRFLDGLRRLTRI